MAKSKSKQKSKTTRRRKSVKAALTRRKKSKIGGGNGIPYLPLEMRELIASYLPNKNVRSAALAGPAPENSRVPYFSLAPDNVRRRKGLARLVAEGNAREMQKYIKKYGVGDEDEATDAIIAAIGLGNLDILRFLHKDMKIPLNNQYNLLKINAIAYGHLDIIKYLVANGVITQLNERDFRDVIRHGHLDILHYMFDDLDITMDSDDANLLWMGSLRHGHLDIAKYLYEYYQFLVDDNDFNELLKGGWPLRTVIYFHQEFLKQRKIRPNELKLAKQSYGEESDVYKYLLNFEGGVFVKRR